MVYGPLLLHDLNVDETCLGQLRPVTKDRIYGAATFVEALVDKGTPAVQGRVLGEGAVIAGQRVDAVLKLDITSRGKVA